MSTRLSASDEKPMRVREDSLEECVVLERGRWCVCVSDRSPQVPQKSYRERKEKGGWGLAQFHELMKNDLAESSVLCPRLGLNGWGLEGGMRRNIDGRVEDLSNHPPFLSCLLLLLVFLIYSAYSFCSLSSGCVPKVSCLSGHLQHLSLHYVCSHELCGASCSAKTM